MRIKKVNRYYCEFCKKAGCSGGHISRHESACTLNPNRICRMCKAVGGAQKSISDLVAILPNVENYLNRDFDGVSYSGLGDATDRALPLLRKLTDGCPACILAALRQAKIPIPATSFKFTEECRSVWAELNRESREADERNCYR